MIQVYDDILTDEESKEFEAQFLRMPWFLSTAENHASVTKNVVDEYADSNTFEPPQLTNFLYISGRPNFQQWVYASQILEKFSQKTGTKISSLYRCKANLTLQSVYETNQYTTPHRDMYEKHKVIIYYVNDSDGSTVFFDKNKQITDVISPLRGRFVLFDGETLHAGQPPFNSRTRILLNYNFL